MLNRIEPLDQLGEPLIRQHQRITAAEDDFADAGVLLNRGQSWSPVVEPLWFLIVRIVPPEAVAAVDRARAGCNQQDAPWYFCSRPGALRAASSSTASVTNPGTTDSSSATGRTCRSRGSCGSPGVIRAR